MLAIDNNRDRRVAWIINHATLRAFEVPLLRSLGLEVWTSKRLLRQRDFCSASVDYSGDQYCTLPADSLQTLNEHNFYEDEFTPPVAQALNRYFGTVICGHFIELLREITAQFWGRILLRTFGREHPGNYSQHIREVGGPGLWRRIREIKHRFWFAPCYAAIAEIEDPLLRLRSVTLPLGLPERVMQQHGTWTGGDNRLLFFCPHIASRPSSHGSIYWTFKKSFGDLPHLIAGPQASPVDDPAVAGYVPDETLETWLRTCNVMFYHSREPRRLHYQPLEAIAHGMPVIYLRGGLLEALGGPDQPGACTTVREARKKIRRILKGEQALVEEVRRKQQKILETFTWDYNRAQWQRLFVDGVLRAGAGAETAPTNVAKNKRIALILPQPYRGGTLRATKDLAKMIRWSADQRGANVDVVMACLKDSYDFDADFTDIKKLGISVRPLLWKMVLKETGAIAEMSASGQTRELVHDAYALPADGGNDFLDCDFWLLVSDRLTVPLLPVRPYGAVVFDYIQRYVPDIFPDTSFTSQAQGYIPFVREAKFVMVTTPATGTDLNAYAGVPQRRICRIPLFFELIKDSPQPRMWKEDYLIWVTNCSPHKNHVRILKSLEKYYDELGGRLKTIMVGPLTDFFLARNPRVPPEALPSVDRVRAVISNSYSLRRNLRIEGELPEAAYACAIKHARFLLHGNLYDNGTFSVIDAASLGVPTLSSRYPCMEYLNETCRLNLTFFDPRNIEELARSLKAMETGCDDVRLPERSFLERFHWRQSADAVCDTVLAHAKMGIANAHR
jgi:glycosyltransferase involved in cell wall biosynthesis